MCCAPSVVPLLGTTLGCKGSNIDKALIHKVDPPCSQDSPIDILGRFTRGSDMILVFFLFLPPHGHPHVTSARLSNGACLFSYSLEASCIPNKDCRTFVCWPKVPAARQRRWRQPTRSCSSRSCDGEEPSEVGNATAENISSGELVRGGIGVD